MARACHTAVRMAVGDVFTDADIEDWLNRMEGRARRLKLEKPTATTREALAEAAGQMTKEALKEALIARRLKTAAEIARNQRRTDLAALPAKMDGAKRLEALNVGSERQGFGTSKSIDAVGRALQMDLWGQVKLGLDQMPGLADRLSNFLGLAESGFPRKVAREMAGLTGGEGIEPTGDEGALHAARVLVAALERGRQMQNDAGAWIDRLPGYIGRQAHNPGKVGGGMWRELGELGRRVQASKLEGFDWAAARAAAAGRAFRDWHDFIRPRLAEKTFEGLDAPEGDDLKQAQTLAAQGVIRDPTDARELMLHRIWTDIVTGQHAALQGGDDLGDFRPKGSMARAVSAARVLHFTDPDAWIDYADKYGNGGLFATVMSQLERAGRNTALMRVWGPAPEAAFDAERARLVNEARAAGDTAGVKALGKGMVQARFEAVNGMADAPENMRLAQFMNGARQWEALTKLGSIVLSKATDLPITAGMFKRVGGTWLEGYRSAFFDGLLRLGSADAKAAAEALDVGARHFAGHVGGQYLASDGPKGWLGWGVKTMYKINGFESLNNSIRFGAASGYAALLGREAAKDFDHINIGTRETLQRFGIRPEEWDAARQGIEPAADGRAYFTLDRLEGELKLKFATMVHDLLDNVVSEPRARERSGMTRGTKAGTLIGEFDRSFFQFKGFVNTIVGRHLVPAARGAAGVSPVFLLAHLVLGTTLAGYVSMEAKALSRGELPRAPDNLATWLAALSQGGGLGLYGDFLFGEANRNGADFDWGSLGGPIISDSEQVAKVVRQAISGGAVNSVTGRSQIPAELVHLGASNIPLVNLWYTRLALDYGILWRLEEAASPGYLRRYDQRIRNQQHSSMWLDPQSVAQ